MVHYVFLDLSYLVFHRFFAIVSWTKLTKKPIEDVEEFKARFAKGFEEHLLKMKKKLGVEFENMYVARDTSRHLIWRAAHFPAYKKNRDDNKQNFDPSIFAFAHETMIPELKAKYGFKTIGVPTAEADDVIAISCKYLKRVDDSCNITVITNDNDFVQLTIDPGSVTVMNASWLDISGRFDNAMLSVYTEWKVIKGDKSDNIPAIDKKIGDKTALKLATNPELLAKRLESPVVMAQYRLNKTLISFDSIPADLVITIEAEIKKLI